MFFPFTNSTGAFVGTISSLICSVWIFVGFQLSDIKYPKKPLSTKGCNISSTFNKNKFLYKSNFGHSTSTIYLVPTVEYAQASETWTSSSIDPFLNLYAISYTWYDCIAVVVAITVGIIVSVLTSPKKQGEVNSKYLVSIFDTIIPDPCLSMMRRMRLVLNCGSKYGSKYK